MGNRHKEGFVSLVGAGPGDPGLITVRGRDRLLQSDVVVYDRLANPLLLRLAPQAEWISVGKRPDHHRVTQQEINTILIDKAKLGQRVVRLKGGDPFVFGRGGEEALALRKAGVDFEIIPGVTSAIAVPAYAGIPVTYRNCASSFAVIAGHRTSRIEAPESEWLQNSWCADTLIFLMGVKNLPRIVEQLLKAGRSPDTPAALIERGTFAKQKTISGTLANIVEKSAEIRPPAVCIIGKVVDLRAQLRWFDVINTRPLFGLRILNTKSYTPPVEYVQEVGLPTMDDFDERISSLGGEAIHMPVLHIVPAPLVSPLRNAAQALTEEDCYRWVVFTSVNGVKAFFEQLKELGYDSRGLNGVQIAAIGPVTAQALQERGIRPDFIPMQYIGSELGTKIPIQTGDRILLPRSEIALPELPQILKARGGVVDEISAYGVKSAHPDPIILNQLSEGKIDVVAFFSPSGLTGLSDLFKQIGQSAPLAKLLAQTTIACIGPTTAKTAQGLGLHVGVMAREFTSNGLIEELVKWRKLS